MEKIREFIDSQETVYIVKTEDMVLDSINYTLGEEVLGTGRKGVVFDYCGYEYGIHKWSEIENYSLVSVVDFYSSEKGGDDCRNITHTFDCKTLEITKIDLVIY